MYPTWLRGLAACACLALVAACERAALTVPDGAALNRTNGVQLLLVNGGQQTAPPSTRLPEVVAVRVLDVRGAPVAGATVNFLVHSGSVSRRQAETDAGGYAWSWWTLGPEAGPQTMRVSGTGGTLVVTANAPSAVALLKVVGDSLTGTAGARLAAPQVVRAVDAAGRPVAGVRVLWNVGGGGSVHLRETPTNADGFAWAWWTLGAAGAQSLTATIAGAPPVVFTATLAGTVARVQIRGDTMVIPYAGMGQLTAALFDARGKVVTGGRVTWKSLTPALAPVDSAGRVYGLHDGVARVSATVGGVTAYAFVKVLPPAGPRITGMQIESGPHGPRSQITVQLFSVSDEDGVVGATVTARSPDRTQSVSCNMLPAQSYSVWYPGPKHAQWICTLHIPADARHGLWKLDPVTGTDSRGNRTLITGEVLLGSRPLNTVSFHIENAMSR